MDINDWRGVATILVMIAFAGICWWAFSPKRKAQFNDAANLPFADADMHKEAQEKLISTGDDHPSNTSVNEKQDTL